MTDHTTQLVPFEYESTQVRVITIEGEPWFVLADLTKVLGLRQFRADRLDDGVIQSQPIHDRLGRPQNATIVSEAGMYEVVIRSDKPEAAKFRRWITAEVLPTIRRTGSYNSAPALTGPELMAQALLEAASTLKEKDAQIALLAPKAHYVDEFVADEDLIQFRTLANQLEISESDLREVLIERSWIYRVTGTRWSNSKNRKETIHQYRAYAEKKKYFRLRPLHKAPRVNGEVRQTLLIVPAGAEAIARNLPRWTEGEAA